MFASDIGLHHADSRKSKCGSQVNDSARLYFTVTCNSFQLEETDYVMRCFLVVVFVLLTVNADSSCENICTFLYNNPDWESHNSTADTEFIQPVTAGSVTGVVTASFETFTKIYGYSFDNLRFIKGEVVNDELNESDIPLFFKIFLNSNGVIVGKRGGTTYGRTTLGFKISDNIQISDIMNSDFYDIFFGAPGEAHTMEYNLGISSTWEAFQNNKVRLKDVQTIKSDGRCTVYKYMSACTDPTPRLCDDEQHVSENVNPGSSFILSCSGSGAPFLDVTWTKDGNPTDIEPTIDHTTTEPDHKIQSTITIDSITVDHLGNWTCTIMNMNFKESVSKTYELKYTHPATLVKSPDIDYYQGSETNITTLIWVVQSWPLEQVTMDCGNISVSTGENTTSIPPQLTFALVLSMQHVVNCVVKDGDTVLETREITRVGYNCKAGEGGVGKECKVCETGKTSEAGIGDCFPANSSCIEGSWGVDEECSSCPANQTSFNGTVKSQECFPDLSYCEEGQYGYGNNCSLCPTEKTSFSKAKKITECFPDVSYCEEGEYGYGDNCTSCPTEKTSFSKSKKIIECFPDVSFCQEGQFGYGDNCSLCPKEKTSFSKAKKITECFPDVSYCEKGEYGYGFNCTKCPDGTTNKSRGKKLADCRYILHGPNKSSLVAAWTLAGFFFMTTATLAGLVFQKFLRGKCSTTDDNSVHEYVENTITHPPDLYTAGDATYNNHELYKL